MLSVSHGLSGAVIATLVPLPAVYIPVALILHLLEDWTPHWDVGTGLSSGKRSKRTALILEFFDLLLLAILLWWWWQGSSPDIWTHALVGVFFALLPDFLEAPRNFLGWEPKFLKPITAIHSYFHHSIPDVLLGLFPQLVVIGYCWMLLRI